MLDRHKYAPPFFANLLPEGPLRDYLAECASVKPEREFFLIGALGRDLPGALEIQPTDHSTPRDESAAVSTDPTPDLEPDAGLHFSLAGVQLKFSAVQDTAGRFTIPDDGVGGSWIVKLPSTRFPNLPENEFAMMELARRVGISIPDTKLTPLNRISGLPKGIEAAGERAYVIKRFDRAPNGKQIHIEDFAQVFGVYPERK
jgi:serine/threonine-protein kinase HipA